MLRVLKVLGVPGVLGVLGVLGGVCPATLGAAQEGTRVVGAEDLIRAAVAARLARTDAEITVAAIDAARPVDGAFRSVRLDPAAVLGKPMRVTLVPVSGQPVIAVAAVRVVAEHVVAARELSRGEILAAGDFVSVHREILGVPLRRLPTATEVMGARTLRTVPAGAVFLPGAVALRRAVEAGDSVTVVARAGDAEVSALMVAADGGDPGDVIRVSHPDTRKQVRARVRQSGVVEVLHAR